jgi:asparagine synthase (glutamine-hydrolysing)
VTGFAGLLSSQPLDRDATGRLLAAMARDIAFARGDLTETYAGDYLGVTRVHHGLLNPEPQPIFNEEGSLCIVMDGEVFGYERERRSLEERGHRFRFESNDAEFCLHLYEEYGEGAFVRLDGSYALMVCNLETGELLLVGDRAASHPVFYHHGGEKTLFGTQLRPLLGHPSLPRHLDLRTVFEFFALGRVLWDHTFYADVKVLPPAAALRCRNGECSLICYWRPESGGRAQSEEYYVEALAHGLREAVAKKTRGDHRFGILLSGGIDSRSVVASAEKPLMAFTLSEFENREVDIARQVATEAGAQHAFLRRGFNHYPDLVEEAIAIGDGMQRFDHALVLGLTDEIRAQCDVLLDAFGFDGRLKGLGLIERRVSLLGREFRIPRLREIPDGDSAETWAGLRPFRYLPTFHEFFRSPHRQTARDVLLTSLEDVLGARPGLHPQDRFAHPLVSSFRSIGGYLMVLAARAHLPQRSVIFDNGLLELSLSIPPHLRARGRVLRRALRRLSPGLAAIPDANTGLRPDLPVWLSWLLVSSGIALREAGICPRRKLPHPAFTDRSWPYWSELIRRNEKLRTMIEATIRDPECLDPELFDADAVWGIHRDHMERKDDYGRRLFQILTFGRWHKSYGPE